MASKTKLLPQVENGEKNCILEFHGFKRIMMLESVKPVGISGAPLKFADSNSFNRIFS